MPKVISYTPPWLSRPNPGFQVFSSTPPTLSPSHTNGKTPRYSTNGHTDCTRSADEGPRRTIARRGTEIFVVADNQIRWSDLCMLKENWEEREARKKTVQARAGSQQKLQSDGDGEEGTSGSYRVLEASFSEQIRQLSISPNGRYMAIITLHTIHVALLPESSLLGQPDRGPLRMKPKMIGPTTHVVSQSPIASALWHPYGVDGSCLVTLTEDAVIRLWEINFNDSWSFDSPSLDFDLQKLASGSSEKEDFRPNKLNRRRGFSVDGIGMNVASACFGGTGSSEESPWSAMTLWIAMKEGDIYALCPLLPGHWQPSSTTLASLSASAMSKQASMQEKSLSPEELQQYEDQYKWISDIDCQDPRFVSGKDQFSLETEIYTRPSRPSVPRLQGPFQLLAEDDVDLDLTDIHVIAAKIDGEELMYGEEPDSDSGLGMDDGGGLSASIICLATKSGRVYLCVDLVGVEGQWLPRSKQSHPTQPAEEFYLTTIEIVDTLTPEAALETEWPTFSIDEGSRYSFFLTHSQGVFFFSLDPWVQSLESELQSPAGVGTAFRVDVLANSCGTLRERILDFRRDQHRHGGTTVAAITLQDSDMGYFLLTAVDDVPIAAVLDTPDSSPNNGFDLVTTDDLVQGMDMLELRPTRSPYVPPSSLWERSTLPTFLDSQVQNRHKKALKEEIRLSSATLDLMTHAHRVLSQETHALGVAAADLFRRCERLQDEIRDQISRVKETANRIDQAIDDDDDDQKKEIYESDVKGHVESRLENVRARQEKLLARFNRTKSQFAQCQGKDLSENEQYWISDTQELQKSLIPADKEAQPNDRQVLEPWQRLEEAKQLAQDLIAHAKEISNGGQTQTETFKIPPELRKAKVEQVMKFLERESALIDATQLRLERLSLASVS